MANASKNKGKAFERELAAHLTKVFGLNFTRVPNSGAFTGGKNAFRTEKLTPAQKLLTVGDIIVPEQLSQFSFEAKFYKDVPFHTFLTENAILDKWIAQAKTPDRYWFLVFKLNNKGAFAVFGRDACDKLQYITPDSMIMYKRDHLIVKMDGFFEANKDIMLGKPIIAAPEITVSSEPVIELKEHNIPANLLA